MATPTCAISLKGRNSQPSRYSFKIESFSLLSKASLVKFCSDNFEAGGHKWKLWIYPTGDNSITRKDHASIYLELLETSSFPTGWEVDVILNLFIFNHLQNKYFSNKGRFGSTPMEILKAKTIVFQYF
ncbi:hypothetical protein Ddye_014422 [Dipteronia dyeriana]|uniref:MATH domain-containing protein n=1 Tax=Dipteronia dyeriana TaxID=168575 RepID=A0AAE0CKL2_9ROSI|nr:hypothetical protein Ddye_014422 [Dipteronia dyeriana]